MNTFFKIINPLVFMLFFFFSSYYLGENRFSLSSDLAMNIILQIKDFLLSLAWFCFYFFIIRLNNLVFINFILKNMMNILIPKFLVQTINVLIFIILIIAILNGIYNIPLTGLLATTSALGVGIAFGMRDILSDIFAGIAISIEKPFKLNENIELESGLRGEVYDITWRSTSIRTVYNTMICVPNSKINAMEIINFNRPKRFYKLVDEFYLNYSVPINKVRRIVLSVLEAENINLDKEKVSVHVVNLDTKGVKYLITYFCPDIMSELMIRTKVLSKIVKKLGESNLKPSYQKFDINYSSVKDLPIDIEKIDFLKRIDLFSTLSKECLEKLADSLCEIKINENNIFIKEGQKDSGSLYLLKEGLVEVFKTDIQTQKEIMVSKIESGNYFGEFSLLTGKPRSATIKSKTECLIYEINAEDIMPVLSDNNKLLEHLSKILADRELYNNNAIVSSSASKNEEKEKIRKRILLKIKNIFNLK